MLRHATKPTIMTPTIRRIRANEAANLKALRLHALADSPMAFSSTLAREQAFTGDLWRERAAAAASGCENATFIAEQGGEWVGMVTSYRDQAEDTRLIVGMYVHQTTRRLGLGAALIEAVASWARDCGASQVSLWVAQGNDPAMTLYRRLGFRLTGVTKPLPHTPSLLDQEMVRDLR